MHKPPSDRDLLASAPAGADVDAVIVSFYPDMRHLRALLDALSGQVRTMYVVDNTTDLLDIAGQFADAVWLSRLVLLPMGRNVGIAAALNCGAEAAWAHGAEYVVLSDQDSLPAPTMVAELLQSYARVASSGRRVGVVGPSFIDLNSGRSFPFQVQLPGKLFYGHAYADEQHTEIEALTLITSGSLISRSAWTAIGGMLEALFIDKVDLEWCLRARHADYAVIGSARAKLLQRLGEKGVRVWYLGWRIESAYSPKRIYYQVRNYFLLARLSHISARWKLRQAWFTVGVTYAQIFFGAQRWDSWRMAWRGLWHGLAGKSGP